MWAPSEADPETRILVQVDYSGGNKGKTGSNAVRNGGFQASYHPGKYGDP